MNNLNANTADYMAATRFNWQDKTLRISAKSGSGVKEVHSVPYPKSISILLVAQGKGDEKNSFCKCKGTLKYKTRTVTSLVDLEYH